jgi:hypothetical protein
MIDENVFESEVEQSRNINSFEPGQVANLASNNILGKQNSEESAGEKNEHKEEEADTANKSTSFTAKKFLQYFLEILEKHHQKSSCGNSEQSASKKELEEQKEDNSFILTETPELLQTKLERTKNEHGLKELEYKSLFEKREVIVKEIDIVIGALEKASLKKRKTQFDQEIELVTQELEKLEIALDELNKKIEKIAFIKLKRPKYKLEDNEVSKEIENISVESLFEENNLIKNTVLYVATFFHNLSPQDFEQVVSFLLEEQTTTITTKSQITTEQGDVRLIEAPKEKQLTEIWKESQQDKILHNCFLSPIYLEDFSQIVDFYSAQLREKLIKFFKEERTLYLSQQFKQARLLLFSPSVKISINAIYLSVDMAISSPYNYGGDWLFEIITNFTSRANKNISFESNTGQYLNKLMEEIVADKRRNFVFARISSLIEEMLDYSQLHSVVKNFFEDLISVKRYDAVLGIVRRLRPVPQFDEFYWIKQLLDRGDEEARADAYKLLCSQLKQSNSRIYNLLEKIQNWLPESDFPSERYSQSNKFALQLLVDYSMETMSELDPKHYGCWQSKYPLFAPLYHSSPENKIDILVNWLFYPDPEGELALKHIVVDKHIKPIQTLGSLIAGWFMILWGLEKKEPEQEVSVVADTLIQKVILKTNIFQQKELVEFWNSLTDYLLDEAEAYEESKDNKLKKQIFRQRNIVKQLKRQFKASQKKHR